MGTRSYIALQIEEDEYLTICVDSTRKTEVDHNGRTSAVK